MKFGFFGNTNNSPFMLAEALRDLGHEVCVVVTSQELLHRPESRYPAFKEGYPDWIVDASQLSEWEVITLSQSMASLLDLLSDCDALVLNDTGPSIWPLVRRPAIALLTGSDLEYYGSFATLEARSSNWDSAYKASAEGQMNLNLLREFIQRQREGIREALMVAYMPRGLVPTGDALLDELGVSDAKRVFLRLAELEFVKPTPALHNNPVRIFCATRLTWKLPVEPGRSLLDYKGSDIMIRGLGLFYRRTGVRLDIQLIRKGLHVAETEQLIDDEGLTDQVTWSDEMSLTEVWSQFARCDVVIDQLANSVMGLAGSDAMAAGRPVIGNSRPEIIHEGLPLCQARTAEEVYVQLNRLVFDRDERERMGALGRAFVEENCSPQRAAQTCLERLKTVLASNEALARLNGTGHRYYLKRCYDERQALQATKAELQTTQAELQATQTKLAEYESSLPVKAVRELAGLVKKSRNRLSRLSLIKMAAKSGKPR